MKETFLKDAVRNIKKRFVSWLSIVTIVFIGSSIINGLMFSSTSMLRTGEKYLEKHGFKDLDIACSLGVRSQDVSEILAIDNVVDAEGILSFDGQITGKGTSTGITILSRSQRVSVPYAVEGDMPKKAGECALNPELMEKMGVAVGDRVDIIASSSRLENILTQKEYLITGVAVHPDYMKVKMVDYCILSDESFDTKDTSFDYTNVLVTVDIPQKIRLSSRNYNESITKINRDINERLDILKQERIKTFREELDDEYRKAEDTALSELAKGRKEIDDGWAEFNDKISEAQKKIDEGEKEFKEGKEKAEKELAAGEKKIRDGEKEYETKIADGERQLADAEKKMEDELEAARFKLFDGMLQLDASEKLLKEKEKEYAAGVERLSKGKEELDKGWADYNDGVSQIDEKLSFDKLDEVIDLLKILRDEVEKESARKRIEQVVGWLEDYKQKGAVDRARSLLNLYDGLLDGIDERIKEKIDEKIGVDDFRSGIEKLEDGKRRLDEAQRSYDDGKAELEEGRKLLDQGWYSLEQGKRELADGEAELARKEPEARKQLADAKLEFEKQKADGAKKIEDGKKTFAAKKKEALEELEKAEKELADGKAQFEEEKAKGEKELNDAEKKYVDGKKEAEETLADVKRQIDEAKETQCEWFVQTRRANMYFVEYRSYCDTLASISKVFIPLYAGIVIIVCFFTMAIIVEEQSKQIGTCKAFGMYKSETRRKYLLFGVTAAFIGALLGIGGGFGFERLICNSIGISFTFGTVTHDIGPLPVVLVTLGAALVTAVAVFWSSEKILSCSAVGLLSGNEPVKRGRSKASSSKGQSVYFSLIINNFFTDLGRETISVFIILVCCMLIGLGTTIKLAHYYALKNQVENIYRYDICMTMSDKSTEEEKEKALKAIEGYDHLELYKTGGILQTEDGQTLAAIYCTDDPERFVSFFCLQDKSRRAKELQSDGVMVTYEMIDKNKLYTGREVTLITGNLEMKKLTVADHFLIHVGKYAVMTSDYYKEVFGEEPEKNTWLIKTGDVDAHVAAESLKGLEGVSDLSLADELLDQKADMSRLYTVVVYVVIVFSIMLSFMILLNLSNILVSHRMKEILTMKVNGFSNGQVIGYLAREILLTTTLGLLLGLAVGIPATSVIIRNVESDGFMYLRKVYAAAWLLAVSCNALFALVINKVSFSRINRIPLTDITKY
jgi:putative ABC transport system permease protein